MLGMLVFFLDTVSTDTDGNVLLYCSGGETQLINDFIFRSASTFKVLFLKTLEPYSYSSLFLAL